MASASAISLGDTLDWPFFDDQHRKFAAEIAAFADQVLHTLPHDDVDEACRARVVALGKAGFLKAVVPRAYGGIAEIFDVRTLCLARDILAAR
jgi:acyl-CoA dehydrogenase